MRTRWLDRRIAAPGPYLTLCKTADEFKAACKHLRVDPPEFIKNTHSNATTHFIEGPNGLCAVVCMDGWQGRHPVEVAGLLVHEAVHVWQEYAVRIGEHAPGVEQEAYAIQAIAQELMEEFAHGIEA